MSFAGFFYFLSFGQKILPNVGLDRFLACIGKVSYDFLSFERFFKFRGVGGKVLPIVGLN